MSTRELSEQTVARPFAGAFVLEPINGDSAPRAWHTATYLGAHRNQLVIFGGEGVGRGARAAAAAADAARRASPGGARALAMLPEPLGDLMVLDTSIFLW